MKVTKVPKVARADVPTEAEPSEGIRPLRKKWLCLWSDVSSGLRSALAMPRGAGVQSCEQIGMVDRFSVHEKLVDFSNSRKDYKLFAIEEMILLGFD
ncbi:MAG: hypothetical protein P8Z79_02295 [Sedimentisphaerales bacterium]